MILDASTIRGPVDLQADVCVVGSGSGGAVVARTLAEAGLDVVVVEAGRSATPGSPTPEPTERLRDLGWQATADRGIEVRQGLLPGGSSELGGNLAWRAPRAVLDGWSSRGLDLLGDGLVEGYQSVERRVPTGAFAEGASHPLEDAAAGADRVHRRLAGFLHGDTPGGDPPSIGRSVRSTWLDGADLAGARIVCGFPVDGIDLEDGPVVRALSREEVPYPLRVRAPAVVLATGAIHTPSLMMWSHFPNAHRRIGRGLLLQPSAPLIASFDDGMPEGIPPRLEIELDEGEPPDARAHNVALPVDQLARYLPSRGAELSAILEDPGRLSTLLVTLRDRRPGWVVPMTESHAVIRYELAPGDRRRLRRALEEGVGLLLSAGASRVWTSHAVPTCITGEGELEQIRDRGYLPCDLGLLSTSPLGTCAAGDDPDEAVTGEGGRVHGLEGIYVADASLIPDAPGVPLGHTVAALALRVADAVIEDLGRTGA